jgi:hypothetical protein
VKTTMLERESSGMTSAVNADQLLREEAIRAKDMVELGYMKLAKCLYDIYNQSLYQNWDFLTFENYVDTELQINYRKAMYLVEIYNKALLLNMDMVRLEKLGWTKARELIRVVDQANADEWLSVAESSTFKELNVLVKQEKDKTVDRASVIDEVPTITTITFKLGMVEHAIIRDALDESSRLINTEDLTLALANICQEWGELKGVVPLQTTLEDHIEHLERIYGRKLVISGIAGSVDDLEDEEDDEEDFLK